MDVVATSLLPNAKAVVCASMSVLHGLGMIKFKYEYENMLAGILRIGITLHRFLVLTWYKCEAGWSDDLAYRQNMKLDCPPDSVVYYVGLSVRRWCCLDDRRIHEVTD
ncbi:hypothetical protein OUZ56_020405 [Daphnia magna]|uniref:Uncharacterized protein n=1 Tax=Daphnia magna TaxID=35525 RepID=A0ABQ9ZEE3_9CRUS|nr:hypothetical protein OUZ56_020405 [Daphnia magna]